MVAILVDDFEGDPNEFYALVVEEVKKKEVPEVSFAVKELGFLNIYDNVWKVQVLAFRYGRSFHVTTEPYRDSQKLIERANQKEANQKNFAIFAGIRSGVFTEAVNRAVQRALARYMAQRQVAAPPDLDPKSVFYVREESR